ncbi:RpnC/YadD family protein [Paraliomyxa miuraensis]|uniref:hypothetical protein n=1 Tax=Paraliomyxa miuraensis TaxID=376150 RepID=UPI0022570F9B|nr:hypothetical protein [Paraliomyxa miuraensis]MCX4246911.1 hypothetical protein [Paraliomyxa miuraensis]
MATPDGHLALVEITRTLLYCYRNDDPRIEGRLASLAPLFDTVLVHFGSSDLEEILTYVVDVFGPASPLCAIIMGTFGRAAREMYLTIAESMRAEGRDKGRAEGRAQALLRLLEHRALLPSPALRERVVETSDEALLQHWFDRALAAETVEAVFDL